uniref:Ion transport domain-containing protein n=1 Tax=Timema genevievae TaxID=629358 RepID=A0A7R9KA30_TIMGE|nr:unnamed protein product [Timema genevievae]
MGAQTSRERIKSDPASSSTQQEDYVEIPLDELESPFLMIMSDAFSDDLDLDGEKSNDRLPRDIQDNLIISLLHDNPSMFETILQGRGTNLKTFSADRCVATACWHDHEGKFTKILLDSGLNPNAVIPRAAIRETFPTSLTIHADNKELTITEDTLRRTGRTALHLTGSVGNAGMMKMLLKCKDIDCNAVDSNGCTALHLVSSARYRDPRRVRNFSECARLLLENPVCDVNLKNKKQFTAVHISAKAGNFPVLYNILREIRTDSDAKDPADNTLLHNLSENHNVNLGNKDLIDICVSLLLLKNSSEINAINKNGKTALHLAAEAANLSVLKAMVKHSEVDVLRIGKHDRNLLHYIAMSKDSSIEDGEIRSCLNFLLDWNKDEPTTGTKVKLEVNQRDRWGLTPLHQAIISKNQEATLILMKRGSCMCERNDSDKSLLEGIAPKTLEAFFDSCVEYAGEPFDKNYSVMFKYRFLPPRVHPPSDKCSGGEMSVIENICNNKYTKHLLLHPLIRSFLHLKYRKLSFLFYINIFFYSLFVLLLNIYIVVETLAWGNITMGETTNMVDKDQIYFQNYHLAFRLILGALVFGLLLRELVQLYELRYVYINIENVIELCLLLCAGALIIGDWPLKDGIRHVAVVVVFLSWLELVLLLGRLPLWSVQYEMLKTVLSTFLMYVIYFFLIIVGFAMSFHVLFYDSKDDETFRLPWTALPRTFVMMTGEFEYTGLTFSLVKGTSYVLFLLFVIVVFIVLLNLLNGLAVSDTQAIREEAQLLSIVSRVRLISFIERVVQGHLKSWFPKCFQVTFSVFPETAKDEDLICHLRPNKQNHQHKYRLVRKFKAFACRVMGLDMDPDIIQAVKEMSMPSHEDVHLGRTDNDGPQNVFPFLNGLVCCLILIVVCSATVLQDAELANALVVLYWTAEDMEIEVRISIG